MAFSCAPQTRLRHPVGMVQSALLGPQSGIGTGGSPGGVANPPLHEVAFDSFPGPLGPVCLKQRAPVLHLKLPLELSVEVWSPWPALKPLLLLEADEPPEHVVASIVGSVTYESDVAVSPDCRPSARAAPGERSMSLSVVFP